MKVAIIGLGFVGLSLAAYLGSKKIKVTGIDLDNEKLQSIKKGIPPFYENKLKSYLKKAIDSFNTKKGKSEYLFGLSKLLSGEEREGCYYLALSHNNFKYNLAYSVYQKFCN